MQRTAQGAAAELRRFPAEETARRGDEIHKREVRARVEAGDHGKVVAIDIETSAYFRATLLSILVTFGNAAELDRSAAC